MQLLGACKWLSYQEIEIFGFCDSLLIVELVIGAKAQARGRRNPTDRLQKQARHFDASAFVSID